MLEALALHQPELGSSGYPLPRVTYCSLRLSNNCMVLQNICARRGVEIAGVTKATSGNPDIARLRQRR